MQKDFDDAQDINSPRENEGANDDQPEREENARIIQSRQSRKNVKSAASKIPTQPSAEIQPAATAGDDEEESYEEESEEEKIDYDGWLKWDEAKAQQMIASQDIEAQKRAHYRLGLIQ